MSTQNEKGDRDCPEVIKLPKKIAPCYQCGKETYNLTKEWTGFCSNKCENVYKLRGKTIPFNPWVDKDIICKR